jgi:glutathione peroxidase-family protein
VVGIRWSFAFALCLFFCFFSSLTHSATDFDRWNFEKFLIDKNGQPVKRYGSNVPAKDLENDIKELLQ